MKFKIYISTILFILIMIFNATILSVITTERTSENAGLRAFYQETENSIDAVFIGPSSTFTAFLPPIAWNNYGITTSVYAIPNMTTGQYIYAVKEVIKRQNFIDPRKWNLHSLSKTHCIFPVDISLNALNFMQSHNKSSAFFLPFFTNLTT